VLVLVLVLNKSCCSGGVGNDPLSHLPGKGPWNLPARVALLKRAGLDVFGLLHSTCLSVKLS